MNHTLINGVLRGTITLGLALALGLGVPTAAGASSPDCTAGDLNHPKFQRRPEMDRCEGINPTKPIAANLLVLTSYTIGQATPQPSPLASERGGSVFALQIPVVEPGLADPEVAVTARKGNYRMEPLRFTAPKRGWKGFTWGAAVIQGQRIASERLRATALLKPPGDSQQVLPVRFAPAFSYRLVMSTDASLTVTSVRILDLNKRKVADCAGPGTRIDPDLLCTWNAANLPAGTYTLQARDEDGKPVLNQLLRHDPRWLKR